MLDLDAPAGPPALGLDTYAASCARQLEQEIADLTDPAGAPPGDGLRAMLGVRRLAAALLQRADRAAGSGSAEFIAGFRLYRGRAELDEILASGALETGGAASVAAALDRFNGRLAALPDPLPAAWGGDLDDELGALLRPLADAVGSLASGPVTNHWIVVGNTTLGPEQVEARIEAAALAPEATDELRRITGFLRRGSAFAEYRRAVERTCRLLADVLDLADAIARAGWLDERREEYLGEIHEAVMLLGDPATRPEAEERLRGLAAAGRAIDRISKLSQSRQAARIDLEAVRQSFLAAAASPGDHDRPMETLVGVLDVMVAYRELAEPQLAPELRRAWRKLDASYVAAERAVVKELPVLVGRPDALADPGVASLLGEHAQYVEDLACLAKVPGWLDTLRFISPRGAGLLAGHVRQLAAWLTDPVRRPGAVAALGEIDDQVADFHPMPFEQALGRGDRPAILATGGLHGQLSARIDIERRRWAEAWGGEAMSAAARRMCLLERLTSIMADSETLLDRGDDALILNRWAAWELDPDAHRRLVAELVNRLKLATTAAIDGDDAALADQLDRIQAPTAALVSRLAATLEGPLQQLPSGGLSIVGQAVRRPPPDAWLIARRGEIADICRYEMELQHARSAGREELAPRLAAYVDMLAGLILQEVTP
jgi:hypothetical protein